jgi:hypothetical protein
MKRKQLFLTILLLAALLSISKLTAQPIVGGADLTYSCTSTPGVFELTLVLYRPCNTTALCPGTCGTPCDQTIEVWGAETGFTATQFTSVTLSLQSVYDVVTDRYCWNKNPKNTCDNMGCVTPGTYSPAYEQYTFKGMVNLGPTSTIPSNCCNVRLVWDDGMRDNNTQTISESQSFYTDATINRCLSVSPCNNSPENTNSSVATICGGENFIYNAGMVDPDFDSLSFSFAPALSAYNTPVTYIAPYAFNKPMPWSGNSNTTFPGGIRCDPETGDVLFTPSNTISSNVMGVMVIECKQWKRVNGVNKVIGITRRDMNLIVLANCPSNNPPRFITYPPEGVNPNAPKTKWEVYSGQTICFSIMARDTDFLPPTISDTTRLGWNASIAKLGATFNPTYPYSQRGVAGPREDQYQFCWTPHDSLVSSVPYYFTIQAQDDRCPNPGKVNRSFSIKVNQGTHLIDTTILQKADSGCGRFYFTAENKVHQHNLFYKSLTIALKPNDKTFALGSTVYRYGLPQMHIFNDTGLFYMKYIEIDSTSNSASKPYREYFDSIQITTVHQIIDSVKVTQPNCSNNGLIEVFPIGNAIPYSFALNNLEFNSNPLFDSLAPNTYSLYIKDNTGCIKAQTIMLNKPSRLIENIVTNNYYWHIHDTVAYMVNLKQPIAPSYDWTVDKGTIVSGQGTATVKVVWGNLSEIGRVKVRVSDNSCIDSSAFDTYWMTSGITNESKVFTVNVFPNPTNHSIYIEAPTITDETIQIFDIHGKMLLSEDAKQSMQVDISNYAQGIYLLKIGTWKGKVIKEN